MPAPLSSFWMPQPLCRGSAATRRHHLFPWPPLPSPLYADLADSEQRRDVHGGVAPQSIICALMQGPEAHYAIGREICETMWSPILRVHRVTTEQLAILEPGLSEMIAMPFVDVMIEAVELCASRYGIPREAAFDFMIGHLNVEISMWFGFTPKVPSDAALRLMRFARGIVVRENWDRALDPKVVREASELIVNG
nr:phosphogluconate dehydrogenase C-terminal domain-containing protein [Marinicella sp. W31]MDC2875572.1 phosphogluconate dehydrogenase C-terminal domain-containing protein [Marinicella sp. W31]